MSVAAPDVAIGGGLVGCWAALLTRRHGARKLRTRNILPRYERNNQP
jgi:hypothetical protein